MKEATGQFIDNIIKLDENNFHDEFKKFQPVKIKVYSIGAQRARSLPQLNTLMACFQLLVDNSDDYLSKEHAKFACKVAIDYRYHDRVGVQPDGTMVFEYRSFSFKSLKHMEANNVFDKAFEWIAGNLGLSVDELVAEAQSRMG